MSETRQMVFVIGLCIVCWIGLTVGMMIFVDVVTGLFIGGWAFIAVMFLAIYYIKAHVSRRDGDEDH